MDAVRQHSPEIYDQFMVYTVRFFQSACPLLVLLLALMVSCEICFVLLCCCDVGFFCVFPLRYFNQALFVLFFVVFSCLLGLLIVVHLL